MTDLPDFAAESPRIAVCLGIAPWKRVAVAQMLASDGIDLKFSRTAAQAVDAAARRGGAIAVWPSRAPAGLDAAAEAAGVPVVRIEDGFIRSAGLGAECHPPSSIVVDRRGIYFDPSRPSDLEVLLSTTVFDAALVARAGALIEKIVASGVTKYNLDDADTPPLPTFSGAARVVLVAGQVEDDLSVRLGGAGVAGNLDLLRRARALEPDAVIVFRPHPDVDGGHRKGAVRDADILRYADHIVRQGSIDTLITRVRAVHVLTSLTGFEALLRGREVVVHGQPFYAGWGLTRDLAPPPRRGRRLTLPELAAAALILYPRYRDPRTGRPCDPEQLIDRLSSRSVEAGGVLPAARRLQGRIRRAVGDTRVEARA